MTVCVCVCVCVCACVCTQWTVHTMYILYMENVHVHVALLIVVHESRMWPIDPELESLYTLSIHPSPPPLPPPHRHLKHNITELTQQMKATVGGHDEDGRIMDQLSNKLQQERDALRKLTNKG